MSDAVCTPCLAGEHCNEIGAFACACPLCPNEWMSSYRAYSYWGLLDNSLAHYLWRGLFCPMGWHLWDEVLSSTADDPQRRHYLFCDACDETLDIASP